VTSSFKKAKNDSIRAARNKTAPEKDNSLVKTSVSLPSKPPKYTSILAGKICEDLSRGRTLKAVCASNRSYPEAHIVRKWAMEDYDGFAEKYARARELGFLTMADELIEIVDQIDGNITRDKLRVDTRKWLLSKAMPKGFGDVPEVKAWMKIDMEKQDFETGKRIAFALELSSRSGYNEENEDS
jgi:hypothetical protein